MPEAPEFTILMPCLNEEESIAICIEKVQRYIKKSGIHAEILIADNGSTDNSVNIASSYQANVVFVAQRGYGAAIRGGIPYAKGKFIITGDTDDAHDLENLDLFVEKLREGYNLVVGNRFLGGIEEGAMPWLHRYLGTPVLSFIGRTLFGVKVGDFNCGLRGYTKELALKMNLKTNGMEFASEVIINAALCKAKVVEVPTKVLPSKRSRPSYLHTWRDGWRNLSLMIRSFIKNKV